MINEWVHEGEIQSTRDEHIICVKSTALMGQQHSLVEGVTKNEVKLK